MDPQRRLLLAGLGLLAMPGIARAFAPGIRLLSPASRGGEHFAARLQEAGGKPQLGRLPMRGHGLVLDPQHPTRALVIARRPGTDVVRLDLASGRVLDHWQAAEDRHFYGHAVYSRDGSRLFLTESDVDTGKGLVSVRDAVDFRLLAEYPTQGIGPHELLLMPDGVTLAVANGGIRTLPETGRVKLNRGRIETSLVYLDSRDGRLLARHVVPSTQQSLRHLAVAPDGTLAAALQFEGGKREPAVPLMMLHRPGAQLEFAAAPDGDWDAMRKYAASVAYDPASDCFAISCPLGDRLACWSASGGYRGCIDIPKVSGIAFLNGTGFASNELGDIYRLDMADMRASLHSGNPGLQWDNHLYLAPA